ncbi:MAG: hypothetical protein IKI50_02965 [Clostridia bacterium]|nr:hypothetical protein [Clostridia bacterium]
MATFTNQATLSYNGISTLSNVVSGELLETLHLTKTALNGTYGAGSIITYTISLINSGSADLVGLTLTDDLGAYPFDEQTLVPLDYVADSLQYYVDGVLQATPAATAGPPLTVTGIRVPAGGNALLAYQAVANAYAPLTDGSSITNTVTAGGAGLSSLYTAQETVNVAPDPTLSISKSVDPPTVTENSTLTYTFVIQNSGNTAADAADNIMVTDVFQPVLSGITVTLDGTVLTSPAQYTYDEATGTLATVPGQITVPAATYQQNPDTGAWSIIPGVTTLTVTGTV